MWGEKMSNCWDQSGTLRPTNDLLLGEKCYVGEKRGVEKWCSGGERSYFVEKVSCLGVRSDILSRKMPLFSPNYKRCFPEYHFAPPNRTPKYQLSRKNKTFSPPNDTSSLGN